MRRVVGGDHVDRAVFQGLADSGNVFRLAQRRIHLGAGVVRGACLVREREVVRACFRGDRDTPLLGTADQLDGTARGHMAQMHVSAGEFGKEDVPGHHDLLGGGRDPLQSEARRDYPLVHHATGGEGRLLAVVRYGNPEGLRVFQRRPHEVPRDHRIPVVADRDRSRPHEFPELGELFAALPQGDGADGVDTRGCGLRRLFHDEPDRSLVIGHGIGVRHGTDGGEPARHGGTCTRRDGLLAFVTGFAQVRVQVYQSGRDHQAGHVHDCHAVGR